MKQDGFTLIEAVIGLLILVVGILGFSTMIMSGASIEKNALKMTRDSDQSIGIKAKGDYTTSSSTIVIDFGAHGELQVAGAKAILSGYPSNEVDKYTYFITDSVTIAP